DVPSPGSQFVVEFGYLGLRRHWVSIAASSPVTTPRDSVSEEKTVQFGMMPASPPRPYPGPNSGTFPTLKSESKSAPPPESSGPIPGLIKPPRVSWIPALGIEPAGVSEHGTDATLFGYSGLDGVPGQVESPEWTPAQEDELKRILAFEGFAKDAPSSLEWAQAEPSHF